MENTTWISHQNRIYTPIQIQDVTSNSSLIVYPERWWIVTSLRLSGREVLFQWMLDDTLPFPEKNVRGWIPILFPNTWPLSQDELDLSSYSLPQHGFARQNSWDVIVLTETSFTQKLTSMDVVNLYSYPWNWELINTVELRDNSCYFSYSIFNQWDESIPVTFWLHPYFRIPLWDKSQIEWNFNGWDIITEEYDIWSNGWTTIVDIPDSVVEVTIPGLWILTIELSSQFQQLMIWSLPGENFVCIEPVMSWPGNFMSEKYRLWKNQVLSLDMRLSIR